MRKTRGNAQTSEELLYSWSEGLTLRGKKSQSVSSGCFTGWSTLAARPAWYRDAFTGAR
jgi:hypothetical protein